MFTSQAGRNPNESPPLDASLVRVVTCICSSASSRSHQSGTLVGSLQQLVPHPVANARVFTIRPARGLYIVFIPPPCCPTLQELFTFALKANCPLD